MKTALILHGKPDADEYYEMDFPSPSNAHWIPWLQQKFLRAEILCQTPEMPAPYAPDYSAWENAFASFVPTEDTILVGHSAGCGFFLKWLSAHKDVTIAKLVLVAPWLDPQRSVGDFLSCTLDSALEDRVGKIHVLHSVDDYESIAQTTDIILRTYKSTHLHTFTDKGHFCLSDLGGAEFPELWDICKP